MRELSPWSPLTRTMSLLRQRPVSASPFMKSEVAMMRLKRWTKRQSGQAMVETAIVLPLFIFMVLGTIQLTLIIQARSLTKYAAYRAARAGAMNNMDEAKMRKEAFLALSPVITGCLGCQSERPTDSTRLMMVSMLDSRINRYMLLPVVTIRICGPVKSWVQGKTIGVNGTMVSSGEVDFDDPRNTFDATSVSGLERIQGINTTSLSNFERTRLRVQVEYNHKLIIPFANWMFYNIWRGKQIPLVMRMDSRRSSWWEQLINFIFSDNWEREKMLGNYLMPLVENYAFRMQSNFNIDALPETGDNCISYQNPREL